MREMITRACLRKGRFTLSFDRNSFICLHHTALTQLLPLSCVNSVTRSPVVTRLTGDTPGFVDFNQHALCYLVSFISGCTDLTLRSDIKADTVRNTSLDRDFKYIKYSELFLFLTQLLMTKSYECARLYLKAQHSVAVSLV